MELAIPASNMDFDFNHSRPSSPSMSTPSTPKRFGNCFFSAPTSPTRTSELYRDYNEFSMMNDRRESRGSAPSSKSSEKSDTREGDDNFAFDVSEQLERTSVSADELFDGGKLRPFKPPPRLQLGRKVGESYTTPNSPLLSPKSPRSPISQAKKSILGAFSPRGKKENAPKKTENERGRERSPIMSSAKSGRRATRSVSPFRVSEFPWEEEEETQQSTKQQPTLNSKPSVSSSSKSCKKWSLKDFLLFRSASEGRATDKDPFRKYSALYKKPEELKNSSFRSTDSSGPVIRPRRGPVSAHEMHYTVNKAVSEDLKKKTFLPYKQGILGRLAFNPAVHALANGFGSLARS